MRFSKETNSSEWNNFFLLQKHCEFLQSWEWSEFQKKAGSQVERYVLRNEESIQVASSVIKKELPGAKGYYYCPRGPIFSKKLEDNKEIFIDFLNNLIRIGKQENVVFIRIEPNNIPNLNKLKPVETIAIQPKRTIRLDLNKDEGEILKGMHQKTRYNIRLSKRKGVKVYEGDQGNFEEFWKLMSLTCKRDGFRLHTKDYYRKMLNIDKNFVKLFLAEYEGNIISANIVSFFGDTAVYAHGASSNEYRNVMAPYLLQWEAIKSAKENGCKYYDFYGIDEMKWPGVTRFKRGFGGEEFEYEGTYDVVIDKLWYSIYNVLRKLRRKIKL